MKETSSDKLDEKYLMNVNINNKNKNKKLSTNTSKYTDLNNYDSGIGGYGLNLI